MGQLFRGIFLWKYVVVLKRTELLVMSVLYLSSLFLFLLVSDVLWASSPPPNGSSSTSCSVEKSSSSKRSSLSDLNSSQSRDLDHLLCTGLILFKFFWLKFEFLFLFHHPFHFLLFSCIRLASSHLK